MHCGTAQEEIATSRHSSSTALGKQSDPVHTSNPSLIHLVIDLALELLQPRFRLLVLLVDLLGVLLGEVKVPLAKAVPLRQHPLVLLLELLNVVFVLLALVALGLDPEEEGRTSELFHGLGTPLPESNTPV